MICRIFSSCSSNGQERHNAKLFNLRTCLYAAWPRLRSLGSCQPTQDQGTWKQHETTTVSVWLGPLRLYFSSSRCCHVTVGSRFYVQVWSELSASHSKAGKNSAGLGELEHSNREAHSCTTSFHKLSLTMKNINLLIINKIVKTP